ncbi:MULTISPECIES: ABC transporter permease [Streptomyces]|uniref:ABC transporter permease n=1 Tax=Streptomyces glycanivorans TaxID=3033808 RepID=A0ABY9JD48_9ACTN|nr:MULTISPECIES: ABC transporter permease [unclassified Streptomyces]WLQ65657.1 ABC transporter permease [Streptomyces sp. Alt3]WSQ79073.1 ABC transporter permease [Streptomyces sp. NBC_01213]WSR07510.1 ABC transporter permease [Streptomyces sp. NBC_01208]
MLSSALRSMRTRWVTFVGSFIALALGVGLIAMTGLALAATFDAPERGPERFAGAPVVVAPSDTLRVPTAVGERTARLTGPRPVPQRLADGLSRLGRTAEDRTFPVRLGGAEAVGHPWSVASATPYRLASGRPPAGAGEVVVTTGAGGGLRTGDQVRITTPGTAVGTPTVVGTVKDAGFETAVFFGDAEAARIHPAVDAVAVHADADAVRRLAGQFPGMSVLTGDERHRADPDPDRDSEALTAVNALLGTAAGITGFVSVFVVASTFSFAVAQRRREFGLLRTAGATPGQVRRTVVVEALVVGVLASAAGCLLGEAAAPLLAGLLADEGLAPAWFAVGDATWPLHTAFWAGLGVALAGVAVASHRAGRVRPVEALRDAAVDAGAIPPSRLLAGAAVLLTGLGLLGWSLVTDPGDALKRKAYILQPMWIIVGCALLAPLLVRPLTRLLTWLPARLPGATGLLARQNASVSLRRTAAVAAPVLITVALTGSLLGTVATIDEARATEVAAVAGADLVAGGDGPLDPRFVHRVRKLPGAVTSASRSTGVTVLEEGTALITSEARAADPAGLAATARLPLVAGRISDLDDGSVIVNEEWETRTVGRRVSVWLGDGRKVSLRVAAVMRTGTGSNGVYVTPANAAGAPVDRIDVKISEGADRSAVRALLEKAGRDTGTPVMTRDAWLDAHDPRTGGNTRAGLLLILGIALLYTGIALANTLVMATSDRVRDLAVLRLTGATKTQVLRLVAVEALMVVAVGAVLGAAVAGLNLLGVKGALELLAVSSPVVVPWPALGAVLAACALAATVSAVLPALAALRTRPVEVAGARE